MMHVMREREREGHGFHSRITARWSCHPLRKGYEILRMEKKGKEIELLMVMRKANH